VLKNALIEDSSLCERVNAPALCLKLGMDKKMVEKQFLAIINVEKELGIVGKASFVSTFYTWIE
jgi:translation elongation factor EF-4